MENMREILSNEGGTPVFNTYAVEIGSHLWDAIYDYLWVNCREHGCDLDLYIEGIYEDGDQKFAILRNRKDLTYYRLNFSLTEEEGFAPAGELEAVAPDFKPLGEAQFSLEDIDAYEAEFKQKKEEEENKADDGDVVEDPEPEQGEESDEGSDEEVPAPELEVIEPAEEVVEEEPVADDDNEKKAKYNLEEVVEYQELLTKYSELEGKIAEMQSLIDELTVNNESLTEFKQKIDRENKQKLINETFYMLSDDLKKDCIDNIDTYSYDEIEAKLSVICVRNKVSFDLDKTDNDEPKATTFNLDGVEDHDDLQIPGWVKRAQEVQKEMNLK